MARKATIKKTKEDEVTVVVDEEVVETPTKTEEGSVEKPEEKITVNPNAFNESEENKDKMVRVKLIKNFCTHIGGRMWFFEAGKVYNVPENVKFVLNRAGLLAVL